MPLVRLETEDDFDGWRTAARSLAIANVQPEAIGWQVGDEPSDLFGHGDGAPVPPPHPDKGFRVPRAFLDLAEQAILHRDPERFAALYTFLLRLLSEPRLIDDRADPGRRKLDDLASSVRRDIHKMRAFVRFREVDDGGQARFVAWYEPDHHILRANAGFFVRRFASMRWSILTPRGSLHWDGEILEEGEPAVRGDAPDGDPVEDVWKTYYSSIFNPARLKIRTMLKEMPRKYWKNMPETALVPQLISGAQKRESQMIVGDKERALHPAKARSALDALRIEAATCRRCPLWQPATQTVFGEGPEQARLFFIGEQPGDQEDLAGHPFVGPAGQLFDRALMAAGADRTATYVSNAVKHFKFEQRGKRRIHAKPNGAEIEACRWWLEQERAIVKPAVTVALGATAAHAMLGRTVTISRTRGAPIALADGSEGWVTVHPSYLLRLPDESRKAQEYEQFVADLRQIWERALDLS